MNTEEIQSLRRQFEIRKKNLLKLGEQAATYGIDVPLHLSNQIDHEKEEIARIEEQIAWLKETCSSFTDVSHLLIWGDGRRDSADHIFARGGFVIRRLAAGLPVCRQAGKSSGSNCDLLRLE